MTEEIDKPVIVNPSPAGEQAGTAARDIGIILAAIPAIVAILGRRDAIGLINWLSSVEGAPFLGLIIAAAIPVWRQFKARRAKATLVTVARAAPDSTAIIKGEAS